MRVLVRNLYSSTLDLLGTGATFAQGDLTNYRSIVDAVSGVDKVRAYHTAVTPTTPRIVFGKLATATKKKHTSSRFLGTRI